MPRNTPQLNDFWPQVVTNTAAIEDEALRTFTEGQMNVLNVQRIGSGFVPIKAVSVLNMLNKLTPADFNKTMQEQYIIHNSNY